MSQINNVTSFYEAYIEKLKQRAQVAVQQAVDATWRDFFQSVDTRVREIFKDVIDRFYQDYTPVIYDRNESLYDLLQTEIGSDGKSIKIWFDPAKMTPFHDEDGFGAGYNGEDGLYDQVFRRGWHGGADKISEAKKNLYQSEGVNYDPHPEPGTPYWREPVPYYTRWGTRAKVASIAPLDDFKARVERYDLEEKQIEFDRIWNMHKANIRINLL